MADYDHKKVSLFGGHSSRLANKLEIVDRGILAEPMISQWQGSPEFVGNPNGVRCVTRIRAEYSFSHYKNCRYIILIY